MLMLEIFPKWLIEMGISKTGISLDFMFLEFFHHCRHKTIIFTVLPVDKHVCLSLSKQRNMFGPF